MSLDKVKIIPIAGEEFMPVRAKQDDVGYDLFANVKIRMTICPGCHTMIPAGFKIEVPPGYEAQIRPRSGLAYKHGITVLNSPGTIDPGFRGEVSVILINHGRDRFVVNAGDKIAQMVFNKVETPELVVVKELSESDRGEGGFGSTDEKI